MPVAQPARPIRLYDFELSGHCHRVRLFLSLLGLPVERIAVDLAAGAAKRPEFLARNPFGQVPVIEDPNPEEPVVLADSNAILVYLAGRYDADGRWLPHEPLAAAQVQRWLSVAAGQLNYGAARARVLCLFKRPGDLAWAQEIARGLFQVLDGELAGRSFLVGDGPTIADVALYSYTAHAPEGGVSLEPFANVRAWLARIEALPGFVAMQRMPVPA
ncbi:glutathione S-transferase [Tistlia consotensis]|uniref:Glutathione S-transferase n=1 Tax=Tistlia consotensis USBA 355 TaxID=560819 RepID=A0A1Y6BRM4_9PROT|nr:glutathione S-transferase [Tistlia consotensis]SMF14263.1 glutathione S-transferase [Tistlia consotensis USBA 355]SNR49634.1 glutathione S-transferase [Tistlia consotensis]